MESDRYNHHETKPSDAEADDAETQSESSDSKKKKRASDLGKFLAGRKPAETVEESKSEDKDERSIWQKLLGEEAKGEAKTKSDEAEADDVTAEGDELTDEGQAEQAEGNAEVPLEELSTEEQLVVARDYVDQRLAELADPLDDAAPVEDVVERATLNDFLQTLRERLQSFEPGKDEIDDSVEQAYATAVPPTEEHIDAVVSTADDQPEAVVWPRHESTSEAAPSPGHSRAVRDFDPMAPVLLNRYSAPVSAENAALAKPNERLISEDESHYREAHTQAKGVVAGGLVGYLIGRRRGRIKTEKRLKKVQSKLEKQVGDVQQQIVRKEQQIHRLNRQVEDNAWLQRQSAAAPDRAPVEAPTPTLAKTKSVEASPTPEASPATVGAAVAATEIATNRLPTEDRHRPVEAAPQPTVQPIEKVQAAPVRQPIENGRDQVPPPAQAQRPERPTRPSTAERPARRPVTAPERPQPNQPERAPTPVRDSKLEREALLRRTSEIKFGDTNLKRVYEAKLVDESGLRRLVATYEAGGDLRRALAREFLARELRFERDPALHGHDLNGTNDIARSGATAAARAGQASASTIGSDQSAASPVDTNQPAHSSRHTTQVSPLLIWILVVVTILLAIYATWLTFNR